MSPDLADVKRLLDAFENSDWESVHLRIGDLDVAISVHADGVGAPPVAAGAPPAAASPAAAPSAQSSALGAAVPPPPSAATAPAATAPAATAPAATPQAPTSTAPAPAATALAHGTPIVAPSPGIFWRSPAPGAPPFVDVGHEVDTDTTVCIVELMKLMNNVHAGVTGVVTAILVGNGESVTMGQPIMTVLETPPEMLDAQ